MDFSGCPAGQNLLFPLNTRPDPDETARITNMKTFLCLAASGLVVAVVTAQIDAPETSTKSPTEIFSDSADFNLKTQVVTYRGHVRVTDPQMKLTCNVMTARTATEGGHIESIVAEGDVVVDMVNQQGQTNHATGQRLVYSYKVENLVTNDQAVLTGDPRLQQADQPDSYMAAEAITWDRASGNISFKLPHVVSKTSLMGGTQSSATTNKAPVVQRPE